MDGGEDNGLAVASFGNELSAKRSVNARAIQLDNRTGIDRQSPRQTGTDAVDVLLQGNAQRRAVIEEDGILGIDLSDQLVAPRADDGTIDVPRHEGLALRDPWQIAQHDRAG